MVLPLVTVFAMTVSNDSSNVSGSIESQWGRESTAVILSYTLGLDNVDWTRNISRFPIILVGHEVGLQHRHNVPSGRGRDAAAYIKFILDNWDDLPNHMLFMHPHEQSYHIDVSEALVCHWHC